MKVRVNSGAGFDPDVNLNPRGLHENSGVRQWENDMLVAIERIERSNNPLAVFGVIELPARATNSQVVAVNDRKIAFTTEEQAEGWIERNYPGATILVQPEDITEEIARRKAAEQEDEAERLADEEAWAYEADDGSFGTAKWT